MRDVKSGSWKIISHQDNYGGIFEMSSVIFELAEKDVKHQTKKHQSLMKSPISHVINEKSSEKDITTAEEKLAILLSIQRNIKIDSIIK